jgi:hypothetical protein
MNKIDLSSMAAKWPSTIVSRDQVGKFTGGLVTPGTLANIDIREGITRYRRGGKIYYMAADLIAWLERTSEKAAGGESATELPCKKGRGK